MLIHPARQIRRSGRAAAAGAAAAAAAAAAGAGPRLESVAVGGEPTHLQYFNLCGKMLAKALVDDMRWASAQPKRCRVGRSDRVDHLFSAVRAGR